MAIAFDSAASAYSGFPASTVSVTHTCTGSNRILWAAVAGGPDNSITGVTYAGVAMTQAVSSNIAGNGTMYLFYLVNPATGANTCTATSSVSNELTVLTASYTGASQTGVPDSTSSTLQPASTSSITFTTTSVADNSWAISFGGFNRAMTASTNSTSRVTQAHWGNSLCDFGPKTPAGSISMTQTYSAVTGMHGVIASFAPVAGTNYTKTLTETVTDADTLIKATTRILTQTVTNSDTFIHVATLVRTFTETVTNTASLLKTAGRTLAETITDTATFTFLKLRAATFTETVSYADTLLRATTRTLAETVTNTAVFTGFKATIIVLSDVFVSTDALLRSIGHTLIETITYTDILTSLKAFARTLSETITNTASMLRTTGRTLVESITNSDTFTRVLVLARTLTETIFFIDILRKLHNGTSVVWTHVAKSTAAIWTHTAKSAAATWTKATKHAATWTHIDKS